MSFPAYIYARFSSLEQSKGHSLERQLVEGRAYIEKMGWEYSADRELIDEGRSAFHGLNRTDSSALGEFERKAREGHFNNGAVLVVENVDRLTRQGFEELFDLIRFFTSNGVSIATTQDNEYYAAGKRLEMSQVLKSAIKGELSREESDKKSKRLKSAWEKKITGAKEGSRIALTKMMPGWLTTDPKTNEIVRDEHRCAVLNQIYDWYCEGKGIPFIMRTLNERQEPTWGRGKHANANGWNVATLHKYLTSRTVLGEYQPKARVDGHTKVSKGFVIPDYYPQVITPDKFNQVQALRVQRKRWGGRSQFNFPNLFTSIATCAKCGGPLHITAQNKAGAVRRYKLKDGTIRPFTEPVNRSYLRCDNARRGYECDNKTSYRYETLETSVLDTLFDLAMGKTVFEPSGAVQLLTSQVAEQERIVDHRREELANLMDNLTKVRSNALAQRALDVEQQLAADEEELKQTRQALEREQAAVLPQDNLNRLVAAREALQSDDAEIRYAARVKTHQSLKQLIEQMAGDKRGETHITLHNHSVYIHVGKEGRVGALIQQGPDGEDNWHPDHDPYADEEAA